MTSDLDAARPVAGGDGPTHIERGREPAVEGGAAASLFVRTSLQAR
jgi:hypothetical protein